MTTRSMSSILSQVWKAAILYWEKTFLFPVLRLPCFILTHSKSLVWFGILILESLCCQKCPHEPFPPTPPMYLQNTYIKEILGFCDFIQAWCIKSCAKVTKFVLTSFILKLITALKASNISYVQGRNINFPIKGVEVTNKFLLARLYQ